MFVYCSTVLHFKFSFDGLELNCTVHIVLATRCMQVFKFRYGTVGTDEDWCGDGRTDGRVEGGCAHESVCEAVRVSFAFLSFLLYGRLWDGDGDIA